VRFKKRGRGKKTTEKAIPSPESTSVSPPGDGRTKIIEILKTRLLKDTLRILIRQNVSHALIVF